MPTISGTRRPARERTALFSALVGFVLLQAASLIFLPAKAAISNACTAAIAFVAGLTCIWRCGQLRQRERPAWMWIAIGFFLWAFAQAVFTWMGGNNWDLNPGS